MAILPIKKGEQLYLDCMDSSLYSRGKRQRHFQTKYHFTCNCIACKEDWPLPEYFPRGDSLPARFRPVLRGIMDVIYPRLHSIAENHFTIWNTTTVATILRT